jgi:hypothetical protein
MSEKFAIDGPQLSIFHEMLPAHRSKSDWNPSLIRSLSDFKVFRTTPLLYNGYCLEVFPKVDPIDCIFADPPDAINLKCDHFKDNMKADEYVKLLRHWLEIFLDRADIVWVSFNRKWTIEVGRTICDLQQTSGREALRPDVHVWPAQPHGPGQHSLPDVAPAS